MKNLARALFVGAIAIAPLAAFAAANDLSGMLQTISTLINDATPVVVALALLGFFWGLAMYIFNTGDEKAKDKGRQIMIWGILALFVMLSVFGIIGALQSTLFGSSGTNTQIGIPAIETNQ